MAQRMGGKGNFLVGGVLALVAIAVAFWMLGLSPKRDEASALGKEVAQLESSLAQHEAEIATAEQARKRFPVDYQKFVVIGKAVPGDDDVASLLVQLNRKSKDAGVTFSDLELASGEGEAATSEAPVEAASPTEATAALLPLGAAIGPAGLGVLHYTLTFSGGFFQIADFIEGVDSMVDTRKEDVRVDGRLLTIDSFSLAVVGEGSTPVLDASFEVTAYLTPPGAGAPGGAAPESPGGVTEAAPVAANTGVAR